MENSSFKIPTGAKVLITLNEWMLAPDGRQYRGVYGTLNAIVTSEEALGVKTNARSSNWFIKVGKATIAGCQIHFVIESDDVNFDPVDQIDSNGKSPGLLPSLIYLAD